MDELNFKSAVTIEAAASDGKAPGVPKFTMNAYGGGPMKVSGWRAPVVIDLAGLSIPPGSVPIRHNHDIASGVGHTTQISTTGGKLTASGLISRATPAAREVVESSKNGMPWQASVGVTPHDWEQVEADKSVNVNGRAQKGPFTLIKKSSLSEISFVDLGADSTTSANVAASAAKNGSLLQMDDNEKDILTQERERVAAVYAAAAKYPKRADILAKAIEKGWDVSKFELKAMKADREELTKSAPPAFVAGGMDGKRSDDFIAAAFTWKVWGEKTVEKQYGAHMAEMVKANKPTHLLDVFAMWARSEGVNFHSKDQLIRAAASSISMPYALGTSINKTMLDIYNATPNTCLKVAKIRDSKTFRGEVELALKSSSSVLDPLGPHAEVKTAYLGERAYPISTLGSFGRAYEISRVDIVNDDLNVLSKIPSYCAEAAVRTLGDKFWRFVMSNPSSFFSAGNSNKATGAGSALAAAGLTAAITAFRNKVDSNGGVISMPPATLVCGPSNEFAAKGLLRSIEVEQYVSAGSPTQPRSNVLADSVPGLEIEPRLENSTFANYSTTAWYLFSTPDKAPLFISFLDGQHTPLLVPAQCSPEQQVGGMAWQCLYDFQIDAGDYNAAYLAVGA